MSDWWARHLGGGSSPTSVPQQSGSHPKKAVRWQENYPPVQPRADDGYPVVPEQEEPDAWQQVHKHGYITKAPPSEQQKSGDCPHCGSKNYFKRRWANKDCAPLCVDCGYNGDYFVQSGTLLNAVGARSQGPVQFARTDNPGGTSTFDYDQALANSGWNPGAVTQ